MKTIGFVLALAGGLIVAAAPGAGPAEAATPPPLDAKLSRFPLDPPLTITDGYGEHRQGHFHAGVDLGTGQRVGRPVRAPESGWVERVRCSGVGYGRSLYIRTLDGRTIQLGHLDAFTDSIDAYVRKYQEASGQYEQDLWPEANEFRVRAGRVVAWSGQSGAGGPHLHFEIRRGDFAYHPLRAGLVMADRRPPVIPRVTLEPLDDSSAVGGGSGPRTFSLARTDTVRAIGRLRAIVDARDSMGSAAARLAPWAVGLTWRGRSTECRFDSVSWATDMAEGDYVYDVGRVIGEKGLVLWAPAGYRPRFLRSDAPLTEDAGTVDVRRGDPPRTLEIWARDTAGHTVRRTLVLRPGGAPVAAQPEWWKGDAPWTDLPGEFTSLPGGIVRWSLPVRLAPAGAELQVGSVSRRGTRAGTRWYACFRYPETGPDRAGRIRVAARLPVAGAPPRELGGVVLGARLDPADSLELADDGGRLWVPAGAPFERGFVFAARGSAPTRAPGLVPLGGSWSVEPSTLPLRRPARVTLTAPPEGPLDGVGLCRHDSRGWHWVGAERDSVSRTVSAESRQLGRFALFRDVAPPRATFLRPPRRPVKGPYSRWAAEASVVEEGSGVDARASWLEVDGKRVPTEWDPEARRLRWRPARPPRPGLHEVVVVATDRAGNTGRARGEFRMSR